MLTFRELRDVSASRCARWHPVSAWSLSDWGVAMGGEAGEALNVIKKLNRIRDGIVGNKGLTEEALLHKLAEELADTVIYADLLATAAGIDLEGVIVKKFNKVSEENNFPERLEL